MCDIGPIGLSTVRHRPTNFDAGAKVTRIWHPSLPSHLESVTNVQCQRELIRVLRLEVVGTISECSFARSAEHGVYLQPAMLWDISRVTASRQILERRVTRPTVLLRGKCRNAAKLIAELRAVTILGALRAYTA